MSKSILIPSAALESTLKRLKRLASKAGVSLETLQGETRYFRLAAKLCRSNVDGQSWKRHVVDQTQVLVCSRVTIGEMPATNGYSFVGKIVHTPAGNILALAQNDSLPSVILEAWRTAKPTCDHCDTSRKRSETFLISCPDGAVKRVGRQCLKDFVQADPAALIAAAEFEDSLRILEESDPDECYGGSGGGLWAIDTWHFLACAARCTEVEGFWKARNEQDREPTYSRALFAAGRCPSLPESAKLWRELQPTETSQVSVIGLLVWLEASTDQSDYMHNLRVACQLPAVIASTQGLLASAPAAYGRYLGEVAAAKAAPSDAGHWGTIGQRQTVRVTVLRTLALESDYGTKTLVSMRTEAGHELVTFSTGQTTPRNSDIGMTFEITGTVKKHEMYKGKAQTTLTRVSFERVSVV